MYAARMSPYDEINPILEKIVTGRLSRKEWQKAFLVAGEQFQKIGNDPEGIKVSAHRIDGKWDIRGPEPWRSHMDRLCQFSGILLMYGEKKGWQQDGPPLTR